MPKIKTKSETLQLILGFIWIVSGLTALKNLISINLFHILCRNKKRFILEYNILDEKVCNEVEFTFDNESRHIYHTFRSFKFFSLF